VRGHFAIRESSLETHVPTRRRKRGASVFEEGEENRQKQTMTGGGGKKKNQVGFVCSEGLKGMDETH